MMNSSVLDVLIGLALLFAAFSVAISRINEAVLSLVSYRGRQLEAELRRLLDGTEPAPSDQGITGERQGVTTELFDGPLLPLRASGRTAAPAPMTTPPDTGAWAAVRRARRLRLPSYVPSTAFAQALLDKVEPPARAMLAQLRPETLPASVAAEARAAYQRAYDEAQRSLDARSAAALHAAMPLDHPVGRVLSAALVTATGPDGVGTLEAGLAALPESPAKDAMTAAIVQAGGDREKIVAELARWYDQAMDRLSGWYKRRIAVFLLGYAVLLTALFNLDAIGVARSLWQDSAVRQAAVIASYDEVRTADSTGSDSTGSDSTGSDSTGGVGVDSAAPGEAANAAVKAVRDASGLALPIGWAPSADHRDDLRAFPDSAQGWLLKIVGLLISCFALTAGAPFWFDLLGRLVNMRDTGPKPRPVNP